MLELAPDSLANLALAQRPVSAETRSHPRLPTARMPSSQSFSIHLNNPPKVFSFTTCSNRERSRGGGP
jgi:hypothetical protein